LGFAHPERFWLFVGYPFLVLLALRGRVLAQRSWRALAQRGRAPRDSSLALLGSVACLIVALAQPRWGRSGFPPPPGHDVVLLVDTSRSMGAEDAVPNRLAVAVEAAESLVSALAPEPANRAGLVAFAGRGALLCPLTENLGAVVSALHRLQPGSVRPGGTDIGAALDAALDAVDPQVHAEGRTFVIFSDGEDLADRWSPWLERLQQEDVVVHVVAVGDSEKGHTIPAGTAGQVLHYQSQPVLSQRRDLALETIARATGGAVVRVGLTSVDLRALYRTRIEPSARRRRDTPRLADRTERFPLFLVAALGLLCAGCWPTRRIGTWGWGMRWPLGWPWNRSLRKSAIAVPVLAVIGAASGAGERPPAPAPAASAAELVARGLAAYQARNWDLATVTFHQAVSLAPASPIARYDLAAALFQLGQYEEARLCYLDAREHADPTLRTKIDYALGNTSLALADIEGAIASYDECLASTARAAGLDAVRRDAAINRKFALEQRQTPALPQTEKSGGRPESERPGRRKAGNRQRAPDATPETQPDDHQGAGAGGAGPEADSEGDAEQKKGRVRRNRTAGAGRESSTPGQARGDSPDDRLDAALERMRAAQARRLPEELPPASNAVDHRDW
jgi:Ca-activated chloride channel family protein